ncbi:MAG TPA: ATP-dependent RNA helicase DbpA [Polyangiaceae bacterium]
MQTEFHSLPLLPELLAVVEELSFEKLTPIQAQSLPALLEGKDLIGKAETGSGKTVAFALPLLQRVPLAVREVHAVVLCPTRELSAQVARELRRLGRRLPGLVVANLTGGANIAEQAALLKSGAHLVVGTPGRVIDQLRRRHLRVHRVAAVVLDEADRMLDMGFKPDIDKILRALPKPRQTIFFSATFPSSIAELSQQYQSSPISVGVEVATSAIPAIQQLAIRVEPDQKPAILKAILERYPHDSALIFANLKTTVAELETMLNQLGVSVASLHGDLEQFDRDRVMAKFRNASTRVLVATDVAARGIDLDALDLVVNFDLPAQPDAYVHRIGRTGRAGRTGLAVSLCGPRDEARLEAIQQLTQLPITIETTAELRRAPVPAGQTLSRASRMDTLRISGGRREKLRPGDILGALTGETGGLAADAIGKIEIHDRFAYVAVSKDASARALRSLSEGRIKGKRFKVELVP